MQAFFYKKFIKDLNYFFLIFSSVLPALDFLMLAIVLCELTALLPFVSKKICVANRKASLRASNLFLTSNDRVHPSVSPKFPRFFWNIEIIKYLMISSKANGLN